MSNLMTGFMGMLLGIFISTCYTYDKVRTDCSTKYLTTFGSANYMCAYVGTVEQHKQYLESHNLVEE